MRKVIYTGEQEKLEAITQAEQNGEYLIEDAILLDEKYLIFDTLPKTPQSQPPTPEERIAALEDALLLLLMEV